VVDKIDEKAMKLEARLAAIEYMLSELFNKVYVITGASLEDVRKGHQGLLETIRTMRMPTNDPAVSDLTSAELEEAHARLQSMIERSMKDWKIG
jgi:hypothetical protein